MDGGATHMRVLKARNKITSRQFGPVAELCRSFNRILCAKGEQLWERNGQQSLDKKRYVLL
jgi:hypothetical protein